MKTRRMVYKSTSKVHSKKNKKKTNSMEELLKLCKPVKVRLTRLSFQTNNFKGIQIETSENQSNSILSLNKIRANVNKKSQSSHRANEQCAVVPETKTTNQNEKIAKDKGSDCKQQLELRSSHRNKILCPIPNQQIQRRRNVSSVPTLQTVIDSTFRREAKKFENTRKKFELGDAILAKMSGYSPWAARVEGFTQNGRRIKCFFYGTHNTGSVDTNQAIPFKNASEIIKLITLRDQPNFSKGIKEIELQYGVPDALSVLNSDA